MTVTMLITSLAFLFEFRFYCMIETFFLLHFDAADRLSYGCVTLCYNYC